MGGGRRSLRSSWGWRWQGSSAEEGAMELGGRVGDRDLIGGRQDLGTHNHGCNACVGRRDERVRMNRSPRSTVCEWNYLLSRKEEFLRCIASAKPSQHVTRLLLVPGLFPPQPLQNETCPRLHQLKASRCIAHQTDMPIPSHIPSPAPKLRPDRCEPRTKPRWLAGSARGWNPAAEPITRRSVD
jgi:hypothetical protein